MGLRATRSGIILESKTLAKTGHTGSTSLIWWNLTPTTTKGWNRSFIAVRTLSTRGLVGEETVLTLPTISLRDEREMDRSRVCNRTPRAIIQMELTILGIWSLMAVMDRYTLPSHLKSNLLTTTTPYSLRIATRTLIPTSAILSNSSAFLQTRTKSGRQFCANRLPATMWTC